MTEPNLVREYSAQLGQFVEIPIWPAEKIREFGLTSLSLEGMELPGYQAILVDHCPLPEVEDQARLKDRRVIRELYRLITKHNPALSLMNLSGTPAPPPAIPIDAAIQEWFASGGKQGQRPVVISGR